ncbi:MAG TPA: hypothetical protein VJ250_07755 [Nitrososphaeraceae archaeon]|nr:hypothetical protein [Nitrososphaeraceae archaeon]
MVTSRRNPTILAKILSHFPNPTPISKIIMFQDPENQKEFRKYVIHGYTGEGKLEIFLFINDLNNADNRSYQETNSPTEATFL